MELIRGLYNISPHHRGCVASIGNYDGVHRGHQKVLSHLVRRAQQLSAPSLVITFEPQPRDFFAGTAGHGTPSRIMSLRDKMEALAALGISHILRLRFNHALAALSAVDFIQGYLIDALTVRYLVVGDDFRFGHRRQGDYELLKVHAEAGGYELADVGALVEDDVRISSTIIRDCLHAGNIERAAHLLGRDVRFAGKVVTGDKNARDWGFATANIHIKTLQPLPRGVFAVRVDGLPPGVSNRGVANIGTRPTVGGEHVRLEVHLFDFDGDLYGRRLGVSLLHKLRDEQKFATVDALRAQVERDKEKARAWFSSQPL